MFADQGATCSEVNFSGPSKTLTSDHDLLVLKAGAGEDANAYWFDVKAGETYSHPSGKAISHIIICDFEDDYETCDQTTDWIAQEPTQRTLPNGDTIISTVFLKLDAVDQETVCQRRVLLEREEYEVCSQVGAWVPFGEPTERTMPNGDVIISQVYVQFDAIDGETVCNRRVGLEREPYVPQPDLVVNVDCVGFEVIYIPDDRFERGEVIFAGKWGPKDVIETAHFPGDEQLDLEAFDIVEPEECYECVPNRKIWVWKIFNPDGTVAGLLRDLGYDGTYDAPGLHMQRGYFGCDFYPGDVHGYYVDDCQPEYDYWQELPLFCGFSACE
jgi:hypothetical protein